jgi:hypothetical protein
MAETKCPVAAAGSAGRPGFTPDRPEEKMGLLRDLFETCKRELAKRDMEVEYQRIAELLRSVDDYPEPSDLIDALIADKADDDILNRKDELLRRLLAEFQAGRTRRLISILLILAFAPRLAKLSDWYLPAAADEPERITEVVGAFLDVAARYPLVNRSRKIAANLAYEIQKLLSHGRKRDLRRLHGEREMFEAATQLDAESVASGIDWAAELRRQPVEPDPDDIVDARGVLDRLRALGVIDALDWELVEMTQIRRWSLRHCIEAGMWGSTGITYEGARKRILRARKRIKNWLKTNELSLLDLTAPNFFQKSEGADVPD